MTLDIEQIKADREAGTDGPWSAFTDDSAPHTNIVSPSPRTTCVFSLAGRYKSESDVSRIARVPDLEAGYIAQAERIAELEAALKDVRHEICAGPIDDTLWHQEIPAETTVDFICNTLGDEWNYDKWLADNATLSAQESNDE